MENVTLPSENGPDFLTVRQAAKYLGVSKDSVYSICITKKLAHYKFGEGRGLIRIKRGDLLDYIQRCRIEVEDEQIRDPVEPRRRRCATHRAFKHLRLGPEYPCGAMTAAGKPCSRMTWDDRCYQHQGGQARAKA
jgi:excisionase family DNA binding protein